MSQVLRNPYEVLGVPRDASADDIRRAYRQLAMQHHPDRNPGDQKAEEEFKRISEAYATLRDPESRARFDRYGSATTSAGRPDFSTVDWQTVFQEADIPINWDARGGPPKTGNAVFDMLFGYLTGVMRSSGLLPGETKELELNVPLEQAREGAKLRVHVPGPSVCARCGGRGRQDDGGLCGLCGGRGVLRGGQSVEVQVPRGVRDGAKLRLRGVGGPGQPPGDALVTVRVRLPEGARIAGSDVFVEVPVTPLEAGQGARLRVLGRTVEVPAGSRDGAQLRLSGAGLGGGDMIVTVRERLWPGVWRGVKDWASGLAGGRSDEEDYA